VKPFQATSHVDVHTDNLGVGHGTFAIQLPSLATQIQQVSMRIEGSPERSAVDLRNLTVTIQLANVSIEHGVDIPTNPFVTSNLFPASYSRQVTFYADAASVARFDGDFGASAALITRGVDLSIVGLTRTAGCSTIP
jgi:hypothetical protein